jgi:hypothetical protein
MGFTILKNKQIDKTWWDSFIANSPHPLIYAQSWYLDIVAPDWGAMVDEQLQWVLPLPIKSKYFIPILIQPIFCQQLGFFGFPPNPKDIIESIIKTLKSKYPFVVYQFNKFDLINNRSKGTVRNTFELPLDRCYEEIYTGYSESHKKNLRRATKSNLKISSSDDAALFIDLLRGMYLSKTINDVKQFHYAKLHSLITEGMSHGMVNIYYCFDDSNLPIAGAAFICNNNQSIITTAATPLGYEKKATFLLVDHYIKQNCKNVKYLDFAGSDIKGIADFNKGWGALMHNYHSLRFSWL